MTIKLYHYLTISIISLAIFLAFNIKIDSVRASEGTVELESATTDNYKCYASSIQMMDLTYSVLLTCRNLLYPAGEDIFNYTLWATPTDGKNPVKLGALGLGRASFKTKVSFSNLFVTIEKNSKNKTPSGTTVMKGDVEKITFLDEEVKPTSPQEEEPEEEITPTPSRSARDRLVSGLKRAAIVSLIALGSLIGLVFILTRKR